MSISFSRYSEKKCGRPEITFEPSSEHTKQQKTKDLRDSTPVSMLMSATRMILRAEGQSQASALLKEMMGSPKHAKKYRTAYRERLKPLQLMSGEDALAALVEAKLSRHQYDVIRRTVPDKFPSYKSVQAAKKLCYSTDIKVTETCALLSLPFLLNHTVERLILARHPVVEALLD
ncbi:hypothetical protein PR048_020027 [Dryococelus australis]|uniref:Uncharacterized protein n=1 Tax=Dryococelus australis TaxID=614101 RepID=A0ABQ9H551_9NEOP|nr:hypothetical protein PR048_020027 [Dryococelus australis]